MFKSDSIKEIAAALASAQKEMDNAVLNHENSHFKSRYADLSSVREAVLGPLNNNGIALTQVPSLNDQGAFELTTLMMHSPSGEYIGGVYPLPANGRPQEIGSAITYARRYMAAAICFVSSDEDDDGNAAQNAAPPAVRPAAAASRPSGEGRATVAAGKVPEWQAPAEVFFHGNYVEWGTQFAEHLRAAKSGDELNEWMGANKATIDGAKESAPRVYQRLMTLADECGAKIVKAKADQNKNKTDARDTGTAKSATDGLEVLRLALLAATTDAEVDKALSTAKLSKDAVSAGSQMAEQRRKQIAAPVAA